MTKIEHPDGWIYDDQTQPGITKIISPKGDFVGIDSEGKAIAILKHGGRNRGTSYYIQGPDEIVKEPVYRQIWGENVIRDLKNPKNTELRAQYRSRPPSKTRKVRSNS